MDDPQETRTTRHPPQHVLRTIRAWASTNGLIAAVYGAGSRFNVQPMNGHSEKEDDDLDLVILPMAGTSSPGETIIEEWRSTLSIITAFHVDLHISEDRRVGTVSIFERNPEDDEA